MFSAPRSIFTLEIFILSFCATQSLKIDFFLLVFLKKKINYIFIYMCMNVWISSAPTSAWCGTKRARRDAVVVAATDASVLRLRSQRRDACTHRLQLALAILTKSKHFPRSAAASRADVTYMLDFYLCDIHAMQCDKVNFSTRWIRNRTLVNSFQNYKNLKNQKKN